MDVIGFNGREATRRSARGSNFQSYYYRWMTTVTPNLDLTQSVTTIQLTTLTRAVGRKRLSGGFDARRNIPQ